MNLWTTHASSLRSLALGPFLLEHRELDGRRCHGSLVEMAFLQNSLSLQDERLNRLIRWILDDSKYRRSQARCPEEGSCPRHRIERYILEGGTCPLPRPNDAQDAGGDFDIRDNCGDSFVKLSLVSSI